MQFAMEEAQKNDDPAIQAMWASIPKQGDTLTLEEFVDYLVKKTSGMLS